MPTIRPFRALRYDESRVALERVVVPPPERADDAARDALYELDPRNAIRVLANRPEEEDSENSSCLRAQAFLSEWRRAKIITRDDDPAFYVLRQSYRLGDSILKRTGVFAALELDAATLSNVLPHEQTLDGRHHEVTRVADATGVQMEPISVLVDDDKGRLLRAISAELEEEPDIRCEIDGLAHEIWIVDDETTCARVEQVVANTPLVIADGHHRFAAARARAETKTNPGPLAVFLTPAEDEGLRLLPTHRLAQSSSPFDVVALLHELEENFAIEQIDGECEIASLEPGGDDVTFVLLAEGARYQLTPHESTIRHILDTEAPDPEIAYPDTTVLDVAVLRAANAHASGAEEIKTRYARESEYVDDAVRHGEGRSLGFLVRAPTVAQVLKTARASHVLPPKSTAFRPRLPVGLAMLETKAEARND